MGLKNKLKTKHKKALKYYVIILGGEGYLMKAFLYTKTPEIDTSPWNCI